LNDWEKNGWLVSHTPTQQEIADLLAVADRDLADCQAKGLSVDWRFNIAYNAALQSATAALVAAGFRAARDAHHFRVIQSLALTIAANSTTVATFDAFRKKRNMTGYERVGAVSDREATELQKLASSLRKGVEAWIRKTRPHLL